MVVEKEHSPSFRARNNIYIDDLGVDLNPLIPSRGDMGPCNGCNLLRE